MTDRELLVDCLQRLNRTGVTYFLTGPMASNYRAFPGPLTTLIVSFDCYPEPFRGLFRNSKKTFPAWLS